MSWDTCIWVYSEGLLSQCVRMYNWVVARGGALKQKRWRVKRQAGNPPRRASGAAGQGLPLQHPHSTLCSPLRHFYWFVQQIWLQVSLAVPLSTTLLTVACKQRLDTGVRCWQTMLFLWCYFCFHICFSSYIHSSSSYRARMNHQGALLYSLPHYKDSNLTA